MQSQRIVRLLRIGRDQVLPIPEEMELPGEEARLRWEGSRLIVEPVAGPSLLNLIASWEPLEENFPEVADPLPEPVLL